MHSVSGSTQDTGSAHGVVPACHISLPVTVCVCVWIRLCKLDSSTVLARQMGVDSSGMPTDPKAFTFEKATES